MRASTRGRVVQLLNVLVWGIGISAGLAAARGLDLEGAPLAGALLGAVSGAVNGTLVTALIGSAELFGPSTRLWDRLERAPFLGTVAVKLLAYGTLVALVVIGRPGARLAALVAASLVGGDLAAAFYREIQAPPAHSLALWLIGVAVIVVVVQVGRLVGFRNLGDVLVGRYHRPRTEERFVLFVDIAGSTSLAERVGSAAIHRFLGEIFRVASPVIDDHAGEVYQYVGDEMVITWTVAEGRDGARPVACFFAVEQALQRHAAALERAFGAAPRLRAALHAGPVVAGEVGGSRRAIVFHGDVMNTTARLEQATRDLDRQFLVSGDALDRLVGLEGVAAEDLGFHALRGRASTVRVYAVTAK